MNPLLISRAKRHSSSSSKDDEEEEAAFANTALVSCSITLPLITETAINLGIFDIIAAGGQMSAAEVVAQFAQQVADPPQAVNMVDRMLRFLAAHSLLTCTPSSVSGCTNTTEAERMYGLSLSGKFFAKNEDGVSLAPLMTLIQDKVFLSSWSRFKDAILQGGVPFDIAHNTNAFEYPSLDPRFNQVFNQAMLNQTTVLMKKILQCYEGFHNINILVDVGGGLGHALKMIIAKYPSIKGVNFDLPHVIERAISHQDMDHVGGEIDHVGGDMFKKVPDADAIFMKWILHDWSDNHCLTLLKNCYMTLPRKGKVIIVEQVASEEAHEMTTTAAKIVFGFDLLMMTHNPGGKERTKSEFEALANDAGFADVEFICSAYGFWVIEFYK